MGNDVTVPGCRRPSKPFACIAYESDAPASLTPSDWFSLTISPVRRRRLDNGVVENLGSSRPVRVEGSATKSRLNCFPFVMCERSHGVSPSISGVDDLSWVHGMASSKVSGEKAVPYPHPSQ